MSSVLSDTGISGIPLGATHPIYQTWAPKWLKLSHVYEGSGGFLDGSYILPHPREWEDHSIPIVASSTAGDTEPATGATGQKIVGFRTNPNPSKPTAKLLERRRLARYENVAATIIDQKISALFREAPVRKVKDENADHPWLLWTKNIDGKRTSLTDWLKTCEKGSLTFGHSLIVMDRPRTATQPRTQAEVPPLYLRSYTPLDMPDWLTDDAGNLTAVKLVEIIPRTSLDEPAAVGHWRTRHLTADGWKIVNESLGKRKAIDREVVDEGVHTFGRLNATLLYGKRRTLIPVIGASVLHDPQLFIDHYNLTSEKRELLRKQTFSILNVPLGTGPDAMDVETAKGLLGQMVSTANVMFSGEKADYISPSGENVKAYQDEIATLLRTIFRLCSVPWESDSRDAESEGSMKLKREDMNQILSAYATELETAERDLAELWFRGMYGANWERQWEAAEPTISYSKTFDVTPFEDMLEQAQAALALPLGQSKTFLYELASSLLMLFLPQLSTAQRTKILKELEQLPDPMEEKKARQQALAVAFGGGEGSGGERAAAEALSGDDEVEGVAA